MMVVRKVISAGLIKKYVIGYVNSPRGNKTYIFLKACMNNNNNTVLHLIDMIDV